jgi:hypothetical protein
MYLCIQILDSWQTSMMSIMILTFILKSFGQKESCCQKQQGKSHLSWENLDTRKLTSIQLQRNVMLEQLKLSIYKL